MLIKKSVLILLVSFSFHAVAQDLKPTLTEALLKVSVTNLNQAPSAGEIITFVSKKENKSYEGITNNEGKFEILIPKGDKYIVKYRNFGYDHQYAEHEIPEYEGKLVSKINIKYQLPTKTILENVFFDTNKAIIKPESFASLNKLADLLKVKRNLHIKINGHTDDVGDDKANLELSQKRARNVCSYLIEQGVQSNRLSAFGYGETMPAVPNSSPENRQKNRRIEVEIVDP